MSERSERTMSAARFQVLFVSTGNVCRSPLAERMFRLGLREIFGDAARAVGCESAGTWGHEGDGMESNAARVLVECGGDPAGFVARELSPDHVLGADLILGAAREHREQVHLIDPYAAQRAYSIREFARLARLIDPDRLPTQDPAARVRALTERVAILRGPRNGPGIDDDDVADPFGAPLHVFRLCAARIAGGLAELTAVLAPTARQLAGG